MSKGKPVTFNGVTKTLPEWAKQYDLPLPILHNRLAAGKSFEDALTMPYVKRAPYSPRQSRPKPVKPAAELISEVYETDKPRKMSMTVQLPTGKVSVTETGLAYRKTNAGTDRFLPWHVVEAAIMLAG